MSLLLTLERCLGFFSVGVPPHLRLLFVLVANLSLPYDRGTGTVFDSPDVDPYNKGTLACVSHGRPDAVTRRFIKNGLYVAHRTLPCYQLIHVCVT